MKYILIGRAGTGKHLLSDLLAKNGLKPLKTYTTAPPSYGDATSHEHVESVPDNAILLVTRNGYDYFTTIKDFENADICILDPDMALAAADLMPDESMHAIIVSCSDNLKATAYDCGRTDNPLEWEPIHLVLRDEEDSMFSEFEQKIACLETPLRPNMVYIHKCEDIILDPDTLEERAASLLAHRQFHENLRRMAEDCIREGILQSTEDGRVLNDNKLSSDNSISVQLFADWCAYSDDFYKDLTRTWLHRFRVEDLAKQA